jgi:hypothetical protein
MPSENNHSPGSDAVAREIPAHPVFSGEDTAWQDLFARSEAAVTELLASPEYARQQEALLDMAQRQAESLHRLLTQTNPDLVMPRRQDQGDDVRGQQQGNTTG